MQLVTSQNVFESFKRIAENSGLYDHAIELKHYGCTCLSLPNPGELYRTHGCFDCHYDNYFCRINLFVPSYHLECVMHTGNKFPNDVLEEEDTHIRDSWVFTRSPKCVFHYARCNPKPFFDCVPIGVHFHHECMHDCYSASISEGNWCDCTSTIHDYHNRSVCNSFEGRGLP